MLRKIRLILAAVVFVLITLLFVDITGVFQWADVLSKIQLLPAILAGNFIVIALLVVLTLVFGRIYCSVICPLGILQDLLSWLNKKKNRFSFSKGKKWLRYGVLTVFVACMLTGAGSIAALIAPYSAFGRICRSLLQPVWQWGYNLLASVSEKADSYAFGPQDVWMNSWLVFGVALATLLVLAVLAWRGGRTYCNTICPVGTVLGFLARFSWFKIRLDAARCTKCRKCERNCKASCIDVATHTVDYSRCVACGNCIGQCHLGGVTYSACKPSKTKVKVEEQNAKCDVGRRAFVVGAALASVGAAWSQEKKKVDGGLAPIIDKVAPKRQTPLLPPGAWSARHMSKHCTACQLCVSQCPEKVLRPSTELTTLMQPVMSYEHGYCRPECGKCSEVCPTGAIKPITLDQKSSIQIGHAVWVKKNCLPVAEGVACNACSAHCPANAISMVPLNPEDENSLKIPAVNESRCIGCGACEHLCPSRPFSAIYVEGYEMHREL